MPRLDEIGPTLVNLDTGEPFATLPAAPRFAAAYLGARPIVEALERGADVVITGRVADAALFLAPLVFEHGWSFDDWDRLAAGILVGHLLECSGQVAGGNFSGEWWTVPHPWDLPYPIAEVDADGTAVITKPRASGGRVDVDTVRHQLLYEVHDPAAYLSPDVVADFASAHVHGSRRRPGARSAACAADPPPTPTRRCSRTTPVGPVRRRSRSRGPTRARRRRSRRRSSCERVEQAGHEVREWCFERWGVDALGGPTVPATDAEPPEVRDARRVALRRRAHRGARRPRDDAAHAVGAAGRPHRDGPRRARRRERAAHDLADARRQGARRPAGSSVTLEEI